MKVVSERKRVWGWMFFDWASQPFYTLLLTFIFGPYFVDLVKDHFILSGVDQETAKAQGQSIWSLGQTVTGLIVAFSAPILGALADTSGRRMPWIYFFSFLYIFGATALWWTYPDASNYWWMLFFFCVGFLGVEFATIFTNSILPSLKTSSGIGRLSGSGYAFGYWGGVLALFLVFSLLVDDKETGKTMIGIDPILGLDANQRQGTRSIGPFTAIWYILFMIFFFSWVKDKPTPKKDGENLSTALKSLWKTIKSLIERKSLAAFLGSSLLYRDGLNGLYAFGGIYARLVLEWPLIFIGVFGIISAITAAFFSWIGGLADHKYGPKPVIIFCMGVLILVCTTIVFMTRSSIFGIPISEGSLLPDIIFFICGGAIGGAGGSLQAASRSMMVRHTKAERSTEAFGLYALSGKATAFLAPALIGVFTIITNSPRLGVSPLVGLFILALIVLIWVKPEGDIENN